jgi:hypothetical protein
MYGTNNNIGRFYTKTLNYLMLSIKTNPNSAKGPDKGKIVNKLYCILLTTLELP